MKIRTEHYRGIGQIGNQPQNFQNFQNSDYNYSQALNNELFLLILKMLLAACVPLDSLLLEVCIDCNSSHRNRF